MADTARTFSSLVGTVMRTPLEAVLSAERQYLVAWRDRIATISEINKASPLSAEEIRATLEYVPTMKLAGDIQIAATVRLVSVREVGSRLELAVGAGPVGVSGGFGHLSRTSEESIIQISAHFKITNGETGLLEYLKKVGKIDLAKPEDIGGALDFLNRKVEEASKSLARE